MNQPHSERKHSKFSASGAERWINCPGSVALSEGIPDKDNKWSIEGTKAHTLLEELLCLAIREKFLKIHRFYIGSGFPKDMQWHVLHAANFILGLHGKNRNSELLIETRVVLDFIHKDAFGTLDSAVLDHFGTMHVLDFKYGVSPVSPKLNYQMIFYCLALAHKYHWNFDKIRAWIIQPRVDNYEGPTFWEMSLEKLKSFIPVYAEAIADILRYPKHYVEGSWCHWCKAKSKCPLKVGARTEKAQLAYLNTPLEG